MPAETLTPPEHRVEREPHSGEVRNDISETLPKIGQAAMGDTVAQAQLDISTFEEKARGAARDRQLITLEQVADKFHLSPEQAEVAVTNAEAIKETERIFINMPLTGFRRMIEEGGTYKTVRETGRSEGNPDKDTTRYLRLRDEYEEGMKIKPAEGEPDVIYGYLGNTLTTAERTPAFSYGDVTLILKKDVARRSTFTPGDSMEPHAARRQPLGFEDAIVADSAKEEHGAKVNQARSLDYIEAQIQGGVSMEDVESIAVTAGFIDGFGETRADDETSLSGVNNIEKFIQGMAEQYPDISLTIRIPIEPSDLSPAVLLGLVEKYPTVEFVGFINSTKTEGRLPFHESQYVQSAEDDDSKLGFGRSLKQKIIRHEIVTEKKDMVLEKLLFALEKSGDTKLPQNFKIIGTKLDR